MCYSVLSVVQLLNSCLRRLVSERRGCIVVGGKGAGQWVAGGSSRVGRSQGQRERDDDRQGTRADRVGCACQVGGRFTKYSVVPVS